MTLMAIIDYALIVLFFLGVACLLFLSIPPHLQKAEAQALAPQVAETPGAYLFLAAFFLLLVSVVALAQKKYEQSTLSR